MPISAMWRERPARVLLNKESTINLKAFEKAVIQGLNQYISIGFYSRDNLLYTRPTSQFRKIAEI